MPTTNSLLDGVRNGARPQTGTAPGNGRAYEYDCLIYRLVVLLLGLVMLTGMGGSLLLTWYGVEKVPDIFVALGSAAVGALAGLLAPSPGSR